jgi:hypothetical protein
MLAKPGGHCVGRVPGPLKKLEKQGVPWFAASFLRLARNLTKLEANCILQCTSIGQIDRKIGQA